MNVVLSIFLKRLLHAPDFLKQLLRLLVVSVFSHSSMLSGVMKGIVISKGSFAPFAVSNHSGDAVKAFLSTNGTDADGTVFPTKHAFFVLLMIFLTFFVWLLLITGIAVMLWRRNQRLLAQIHVISVQSQPIYASIEDIEVPCRKDLSEMTDDNSLINPTQGLPLNTDIILDHEPQIQNG